MRSGVDVGVRAVAASMRRQGPTGLNTHQRPARHGGRGPVAHEDHCARQWDQCALDRVWITDSTYLRCAQGWFYLCAGACQFFCVWGLEVGGDSVGVGGGELGEGLFPVGGGASLDEACGGCSFVGGFAGVCEALGGSFVFDVADGEP